MAKNIDVAMKVVQPRLASHSVYQTGVPNLDPESHYRMVAFIPAIDAILLDFSLRYSSHFAHAAKLSSLIPTIVHCKNWDDLKEGYEKYKDLLSEICTDLKMEFQIRKSHWSNVATEKPKTAISALNCCQEQVFPNIFALLTILATLPVSTCEAERIFSKVGTTCSALRSTTSEERLEALLFMQVYRNKLPKTEDVINLFSIRKASRLNLIL